jgi:hypothetical protein
MRDNLKYYFDLYENPLSDGNINMYINGNEKKKDIKEIIHKEKKLIEGKIEHLNKVIKGIKSRNIDVSGNNNNSDKEETNDNDSKANDDNKSDTNNNENKDKEEL